MSSILKIFNCLVGAIKMIILVPDAPESTPVPVPDELESTPLPISDEVISTPIPALDELDGEILRIISDFLPVSSAAFILCSRELLRILGNRSWRLLQFDDHQRKHFLTLLERDLSDWLLCHHCSLFHSIEQVENSMTIWSSDKVPECVRRNGFVFISMDFQIRFEQAQLLMNQYRFGRAYDLRTLSHTYSHSCDEAELDAVTWAEIVAGELLIRVIAKLRLHCTWNMALIEDEILAPCDHLHGYNLFRKTIICRAKNRSCKNCGKWKSCRDCATWFLVDVIKHESSDIEIRVDVRKYLGSCKTPFDPKWRKHMTDSIEDSVESTTIYQRTLGRPLDKIRPAESRS